MLDGYEMPLETAPHERTLMQWPVSLDVYDERSLIAVQAKIALIANTIAKFEPVVVMASGADAQDARELLDEKVEIWNIATDDLWCRDAGPTFVKSARGELAVAHIKFNGWGNKQPHANDAQKPNASRNVWAFPCWIPVSSERAAVLNMTAREP
jgi:agmatine deiminase